MRYKGTKHYVQPRNFREIAESIVGDVEWEEGGSGYCHCPGAHLHSTPGGKRDCRISIEDDRPPTIYCFHDSCSVEVDKANHALRSEIGKQEAAGNRQPLAPIRKGADAMETFLLACFKPGEIISICPSEKDENGERPAHGGVNALTTAEWLEKHATKPIPDNFPSAYGMYIRVNPIQKGTNGGNKDVTAYRHTLIESDHLPKDQQESILRASGLPIAALIDSGGKSIHAWVRINAKDEKEYHERRERIWAALPEEFPIDRQNKNPSRFSRLPTASRGDKIQKLLGVNVGAKDFDTWERETDGMGLSAPLRISTLGEFDTGNDPNNVLGERWLCRGGSLLLVGQSGIGKSSLTMQLAVTWALGLPAFSIFPVRPLRSLVIQAENDVGDLAEMFQGCREGMGLSKEKALSLEDSLIFYHDTIHSGPTFARTVATLVDRHKPDLVWVDPLLNFIGDDVSKQSVVSEFCAGMLNPIAERTGCIFILAHHTGKPSTDPKAKTNWTSSDVAYSGLGSSALTNWAREVAVLTRLQVEGTPTFKFELAKRRKRAGMRDHMGKVSSEVFLKHSTTGIHWEQCPPPKPPTVYKTKKK